MARATKRAGFSVLLSGEGADELFLGYPHARRDLWLGGNSEARGRLAALTSQAGASAGIMFPDEDPVSEGAISAALGYAPSFLVAKLAMTAPLRTLLVPALRERVNDHSGWKAFAPTRVPVGGEARLQTANALWTQVVLAGYILRTLADGTERAFGVEGRVPFLDAEVAALAARVPTGLKIHHGAEKYILREAVRPFVSDRARAAPKRPFVGPAFSLSPAVLAHSAQTLARGSALFDARAGNVFLADLAAGPEAVTRRHDPALFMFLTLTALEHAYGLAL